MEVNKFVLAIIPVLSQCCVSVLDVFILQLAERHNTLLNGIFNKDGRRCQSNRNRASVKKRWLCQYWVDISLVCFRGKRSKLDFRRSLVRGFRSSLRTDFGKDRGLLSRTAAGNRA